MDTRKQRESLLIVDGLASRRLLASSPFGSANTSPSILLSSQCLQRQSFSKTSSRPADEDQKASPIPPSSGGGLSELSKLFGSNQATRKPSSFLDIGRISSIGSFGVAPQEDRYEEPHHFHVYATKHNTHITLTKPNRDPLISVSAGNIGFKKSGRKHYDSAFQLAGYVMGRIQEQGLLPKIKQLEVCLRGFGAGREAVTKAFLGAEGKFLRGKVVKVSDATRLKFGGTRGKKPRRLG
jgi:small subunit ribosomal protein S11